MSSASHAPSPELPEPARPESARLEAALTRALRENHLDESYRSSVRRYVAMTGDQWRVCCGSGCDPCIEPIARAVDQVRRSL
jgi:hypothetical protein